MKNAVIFLLFCLFINDSNSYIITLPSIYDEHIDDFAPKKYRKGLLFSSVVKVESQPWFISLFYSEIIDKEKRAQLRFDPKNKKN